MMSDAASDAYGLAAVAYARSESATLFVTVSGRVVDLASPTPGDVDFDDIAEQVSKVARFNGATPGTIYFVGQHLVCGCDWILASAAERERAYAGEPMTIREDYPLGASDDQKRAAAYFLLHDAEEGYLGDDTTPKKRTIDEEAQRFGVVAGLVREAIKRIVERHNIAIHAAAGLPWPPAKEIEALVHDIDQRMLVTEWRQLRPKHPLPQHYAAYEPLPIRIEPWSWGFAQEQLQDRMAVLLPAMRKTIST